MQALRGPVDNRRAFQKCPARAAFWRLRYLRLLHFVLNGGVGVGGRRAAACRGGLNAQRQRCSGSVVLCDGSGVVGGGGNRYVYRRGPVREADDGIGSAA